MTFLIVRMEGLVRVGSEGSEGMSSVLKKTIQRVKVGGKSDRRVTECCRVGCLWR